MRMSLRGSLCARHGRGTGVPVCPRLQGGFRTLSGDKFMQMSFKNHPNPVNCSPQLKKNRSFHSELTNHPISTGVSLCHGPCWESSKLHDLS